jgi:hypothetical protein
MKKEDHVQHLPVNGHIQTVAFRSLKTKLDEAARIDAIVQNSASFITVGSFSAHSLKFKGSRGYDGELLKLAKLMQSFDDCLEKIHADSSVWLLALHGDEASKLQLAQVNSDDNVESAGRADSAVKPLSPSILDVRLQKNLDEMVTSLWKLFSTDLKSDVSIPAILKVRCDCQKRRSMSISQALGSFVEVIIRQIKSYCEGYCPDFWYILDLIGAFTLTVSCLVSVFHDEMGMLDDTYNACRWVIDRRLMVRLTLQPLNTQTEQDSDFFWTLCEDPDAPGFKSSRNSGGTATSYNMLFRPFPCEKKEAASTTCSCPVCRSHPLPQWDEKRSDEDFPQFYQSFRSKAVPSDFLQPVLVIHLRKKIWDKIPQFLLDPSDPAHLRFDYALFPIFNNVGINENQRRVAFSAPLNFMMQNRVNMDAAAVFTVRILPHFL